MKNLLKFEFYKLLRQKSFYICTGVILAMSLISLLLKQALANNSELNITTPSGVSTLLSAVSSSNFTMICGIFIALFVCTDYDQLTIKNVYSRGFSRNDVYFAKLVVSLIATLIMFVITLLFTFAVGNIMFNGAVDSGNYAGLLIGQFLYCVASASFVFAICLIVKKVGVSIALAILGPSLISTVLSLADAFLNIDGFKFGKYWLDGFIGDLSVVTTDTARLIVCVVLSIVYAAVFILAGYFINKKKEN